MEKPKYFDIHSHLNDAGFGDDISNIVSRMRDDSVWSIVVGTGTADSKKAANLSDSYDGVFGSVGVHPTDDPKEHFDEDYFLKLTEDSSKIVAIGECGLDYLRAVDSSDSEKKRQKDLFEAQLELAVKIKKPLMIHCREAHEEMLDILESKKREYGDALVGNIHFFAGDVPIAKQYFELDFSVSFTGVITFTSDYDEVVKYAPLNMIMSETDSPYVAPVPYRGKRNEPVYVKEVVKRIVEIRGEGGDVTEKALVDNAFRVFGVEG